MYKYMLFSFPSTAGVKSQVLLSLLLTVVLLLVVTGPCVCRAQAAAAAATDGGLHYDAGADEVAQRLFLTGTGSSDQSLTLGTLSSQAVTVGWDAALLVGLTLAGLTVAVVVLGILLGTDGTGSYFGTSSSPASAYAAPT